MDYRFVEADLNELIQTALARLSPLAKAKEIHLQFEPQASLPPVLADTDQLHQLLENLISNALTQKVAAVHFTFPCRLLNCIEFDKRMPVAGERTRIFATT